MHPKGNSDIERLVGWFDEHIWRRRHSSVYGNRSRPDAVAAAAAAAAYFQSNETEAIRYEALRLMPAPTLPVYC